jgi:hypothetical protein
VSDLFELNVINYKVNAHDFMSYHILGCNKMTKNRFVAKMYLSNFYFFYNFECLDFRSVNTHISTSGVTT